MDVRCLVASLVLLVGVVPAFAVNDESPLTPSIAETQSEYGRAIAISGDWIVVGAPNTDIDGGTNQGAAFVFERDGDAWIERQVLTASNGGATDAFGRAVAIDGDVIAVGAFRGGVASGGAVYVYRLGRGTWTEEAALEAPDSSVFLSLGFSVDIDGDRLVTGAFNDSTNGVGAGAAYVFARERGTWSFEEKLLADDGDDFDRFGQAVAIEGDWIVAAAPARTFNGESQAGGVYVFNRGGSTWSQSQRIEPPFDDRVLRFGDALDIDGDRFLVGAPGRRLGAAVLYTRTGPQWQQTQELVACAFDGGGGGRGRSVALDGDLAVLSSETDDLPGRDAGAVYVFRDNGTGVYLNETRLRASDAAGDALFGAAVAIDGARVALGAPSGDGAVTRSGKAYVIENPAMIDCNGNGFPDACESDCNRNGISDQCDLDPDDPDGDGLVSEDCNGNFAPDECEVSYPFGLSSAFIPTDDRFDWARSVSLDGGRAIIGTDTTVSDGFSVYFYRRFGSQWSVDGRFRRAAGDDLGVAVAIDGDRAVAGSVFVPPVDEGGQTRLGIRVYGTDEDDEWVEETVLSGSDASTNTGYGDAVAVQDDVVLVGARFGNAAYVFRRAVDGTWSEEAKLESWTGNGARFGSSVALAGPRAYVGDIAADGGVGAVSVFRFDGDSWQPEARLSPGSEATNARFGRSLAADGAILLVGGEMFQMSGAVWVYRWTGEQWRLETQWVGAEQSEFGWAVDFDGIRAIVGARTGNGQGVDRGTSFLFERRNGVWRSLAELPATNGSVLDLFGTAVAIEDDIMMVGAPRTLLPNKSGTLYIYSQIRFVDCNDNGVPDVCDIDDGTSDDTDGNGVPDECEILPCAADLDGNDAVDADDLMIIFAAWNTDDVAADITKDGVVNADDLLLAVNQWGACD